MLRSETDQAPCLGHYLIPDLPGGPGVWLGLGLLLDPLGQPGAQGPLGHFRDGVGAVAQGRGRGLEDQLVGGVSPVSPHLPGEV